MDERRLRRGGNAEFSPTPFPCEVILLDHVFCQPTFESKQHSNQHKLIVMEKNQHGAICGTQREASVPERRQQVDGTKAGGREGVRK